MLFKKGIRFDFWSFVTMLSLIFFGMFLLIPVGRMVVYAFQGKETMGITLENFIKFFSRAYYRKALFNSLKVVACATVLVILIGVPLAYVTTSFKIRGRRMIDILVIISMLSPPFIGAYAWILMLGRNGVITNFMKNTFGFHMPDIYGFGGILLVFTLKLFPYIYMYTKGALKKMDASLGEAAESLGYGSLPTFFKVTMQVMIPGIVSGAILSWITMINELSSTLMLYTSRTTTMSVAIFQEINRGGYGTAAALSTILTVTMVVSLLMFFKLTKSEDIDL